MVNHIEYALYKGEELLSIGTLEEIAEERGVSVRTIYYYSMPAYQRKNGGNKGKKMIAIKLEDEE